LVIGRSSSLVNDQCYLSRAHIFKRPKTQETASMITHLGPRAEPDMTSLLRGLRLAHRRFCQIVGTSDRTL
jgi:hypothetical protein